MDSQSSSNASDITLLYRQPKRISLISNNSPNVLHIAVALNLLNFVREIVDNSPELILSLDEHGLTPYHLAVANGHISVIKVLLDSKMGNDICLLRDKGGFLPIHAAVIKGSVDVLKIVIDTCCRWMLQELTGQGDNILHLALKFNSLEVFHYLWHILGGNKKLFNSGDAEGNTLLHLAVARRQKEIVKILIGKVDLNVKNLYGSTALDMSFDLGCEPGDTTLKEMIRRAYERSIVEHEVPQLQISRQLDRFQSRETRIQSSLLEAATEILFHLWKNVLDFIRALSRRVPSDSDIEASNALMIVATLIAAITFQSALNPPGGFIQDGKDRGMAALEYHLSWYLLFDTMAFISSLIVILLTIYVVPKWKDLIKLAVFITWVAIFFTFVSFGYAISVIFGHIIHHPLIVASLCIGDAIVLVFAFTMFIYLWYLLHKNMSTFLVARPTKGIQGRSNIIVVSCFAFLGAALVWLPIVVFCISRYYNILVNL